MRTSLAGAFGALLIVHPAHEHTARERQSSARLLTRARAFRLGRTGRAPIVRARIRRVERSVLSVTARGAIFAKLNLCSTTVANADCSLLVLVLT